MPHNPEKASLEFDNSQWATVIFIPTRWELIKMLFRKRDITFCWGQDQWLVRGLTPGMQFLAVGGVPEPIRRDSNLYQDKIL